MAALTYRKSDIAGFWVCEARERAAVAVSLPHPTKGLAKADALAALSDRSNPRRSEWVI